MISCRLIGSAHVTGGSVIADSTVTISQAIVSAAAVHSDEWVMLATFGGIQLQTGDVYPENNEEQVAWLAHPSLNAITTVPNVGALNATRSHSTGVQVKETPPTLLTMPGKVNSSIPSGSTFTVYWTKLTGGSVTQQDYIAMLVALKTTPNKLFDPLGFGVPPSPEVIGKPAPASAPTEPTLVSEIDATILGAPLFTPTYLLVGAFAWDRSASVSYTTGWDVLETDSFGSIYGALVAREITSVANYPLQATFSSDVYASMVVVAEGQTPTVGLHIWQRS